MQWGCARQLQDGLLISIPERAWVVSLTPLRGSVAQGEDRHRHRTPDDSHRQDEPRWLLSDGNPPPCRHQDPVSSSTSTLCDPASKNHHASSPACREAPPCPAQERYEHHACHPNPDALSNPAPQSGTNGTTTRPTWRSSCLTSSAQPGPSTSTPSPSGPTTMTAMPSSRLEAV